MGIFGFPKRTGGGGGGIEPRTPLPIFWGMGGVFIDISIIWGEGGVVIDISIFGAFEPKPLLRKIKLKVALRKLPFAKRKSAMIPHSFAFD